MDANSSGETAVLFLEKLRRLIEIIRMLDSQMLEGRQGISWPLMLLDALNLGLLREIAALPFFTEDHRQQLSSRKFIQKGIGLFSQDDQLPTWKKFSKLLLILQPQDLQLKDDSIRITTIVDQACSFLEPALAALQEHKVVEFGPLSYNDGPYYKAMAQILLLAEQVRIVRPAERNYTVALPPRLRIMSTQCEDGIEVQLWFIYRVGDKSYLPVPYETVSLNVPNAPVQLERDFTTEQRLLRKLEDAVKGLALQDMIAARQQSIKLPISAIVWEQALTKLGYDDAYILLSASSGEVA